MVFDVARVRGLYTSLSDGWTYLNADRSPQIPESVSAAVSRSFRSAPVLEPVGEVLDVSGSHRHSPRTGQTVGDSYLEAARRAIADLTGAATDAVILGPSLEVLYSRLARAVRPLMRRGARIVNSRADRLRIDPAMAHAQAEVIAEPDLGTGEVPAFQYSELVTGSTRLVALSAAHRSVGTVNPVAEIADIVHSSSRAWLLVDVSPIAGSSPINIDDLGADILALDCAAIGGPDVSALVFRDTTMFPRIDMSALRLDVAPGLAGGVPALVDHLAGLSEQSRGTRSMRLHSSLAQTGAYLERLGAYLVDSLGALRTVHIFGVTGEAAAGTSASRIARTSFCIAGVPAATIYQRLLSHRLVTSIAGTDPLLDAMGAADTDGVITIGLSAYNTTNDVDQLVRAVASLA
ncbi:aminotransferase class V-fold PLP-dependent enzyme [Corynebacterium vitaeruminis]|uniref:aminotransferase class V-fold PLP-dependent enzyme n=1 Tax=Corynebacterium vitaeruminis TaxID=38305 RepID=UPI00046CBCEE|nr:aminotransferase class V-fold PLP-dependent enzyme [Corynebacterium vitaeruminis]